MWEAPALFRLCTKKDMTYTDQQLPNSLMTKQIPVWQDLDNVSCKCKLLHRTHKSFWSGPYHRFLSTSDAWSSCSWNQISAHVKRYIVDWNTFPTDFHNKISFHTYWKAEFFVCKVKLYADYRPGLRKNIEVSKTTMSNKAVFSKLLVLCHAFLDLRCVQLPNSPMSGSQDHSILILQCTFPLSFFWAQQETLQTYYYQKSQWISICLGRLLYEIQLPIYMGWTEVLHSSAAQSPHQLPYSGYCNLMQIVNSVFLEVCGEGFG